MLFALNTLKVGVNPCEFKYIFVPLSLGTGELHLLGYPFISPSTLCFEIKRGKSMSRMWSLHFQFRLMFYYLVWKHSSLCFPHLRPLRSSLNGLQPYKWRITCVEAAHRNGEIKWAAKLRVTLFALIVLLNGLHVEYLTCQFLFGL